MVSMVSSFDRHRNRDAVLAASWQRFNLFQTISHQTLPTFKQENEQPTTQETTITYFEAIGKWGKEEEE